MRQCRRPVADRTPERVGVSYLFLRSGDPERSWVEFTLRPEAKFSDGSPVTVEDVIWSLETLGTKGHPRYAGAWRKVASVTPVGERGLRITFAASRRVYNQWRSTLPSRFIDELPKERHERVTIRFELFRLGPLALRIDLRPRGHALRPGEGGAQCAPLHHRSGEHGVDRRDLPHPERRAE